MTQYLVQSGTLRTTVEAENSRKAALWAVHQAMQQVLPIDDDGHTVAQKSEAAGSRGVHILDREVRVSEVGAAAAAVRSLPTMDVVRQWHDMVDALDRLERLLHEGGLAA